LITVAGETVTGNDGFERHRKADMRRPRCIGSGLGWGDGGQVMVANELFMELMIADHPMEALSDFFAKLAK
jgi:hypothetical protein